MKQSAPAQTRLPDQSLRHEWHSEAVYHDGDQFFQRLVQELGSARKRVDMETYIFERGALGLAVLKALEEAAARGARVRLLLDGVGSSPWTKRHFRALARKKVRARAYHPLPWQNPAYRWLRRPFFRRALLGLWKLNRRNHRKVCLIDGRVAFVGGMNVSEAQLASAAGPSAFRDCSVRVEGEGISRLEQAFEQAWRHSRNLDPSPSKSAFLFFPAVRLNQSRFERRRAYAELLRHILEAEERIWITNPYFVPDISLVRALRFAAWNGVDIRLLFPRDNKVWGLKWAAKAFYLPLLAAGAKIYEYRPSLLHAKSVLIDRWALVGSSNLNHRSLLHDLEADVALDRPESLESLERQFLLDLKFSNQVSIRSRRESGPWAAALLEQAALLFRRWI